MLKKYLKNYFCKEVEKLSNTLIIPLGKTVEQVLELMISDNKKGTMPIRVSSPSGANGHRKIQFEENKENLINIIDEYFKQKEGDNVNISLTIGI